MTVGEAIRSATEHLAATSDTARLDAELLMAHALGLSRSEMLLRAMAKTSPAEFDSLVERRAAREPVAHITRAQEFYGLNLLVTPAVLIPRADSETLIEAAREHLGENGPRSILDLGTGSGALLLAALSLWPRAEGLGIDSSASALKVAAQNAERAGVADRADFECRDWAAEGWASDLGPFDLILCNPPYVENGAELDPDVRDYEPACALFAGPEGLDDYRILIPQIRALMAEHGLALFEIGHRQALPVRQIAEAHGFSAALRRDLGGRPRALVLT